MTMREVISTDEILNDLNRELPLFEWSITPTMDGYTISGKVTINGQRLLGSLFYYFVIDFDIRRFREEFAYSVAQKIMDWKPESS